MIVIIFFTDTSAESSTASSETESDYSVSSVTPTQPAATNDPPRSTLRVEIDNYMNLMSVYCTEFATPAFYHFIVNWLTGSPAVPPSSVIGSGLVRDQPVAVIELPVDEELRYRFIDFFSAEVRSCLQTFSIHGYYQFNIDVVNTTNALCTHYDIAR